MHTFRKVPPKHVTELWLNAIRLAVKYNNEFKKITFKIKIE